MATLATRTFGGTVVDNSYVASQQLQRLARRGARAGAARLDSVGFGLDAGRRVAVALDDAGGR